MKIQYADYFFSGKSKEYDISALWPGSIWLKAQIY